MRDLDALFVALAGSKFRSSCVLGEQEQAILDRKTLPVILDHARDFVLKRLAPRVISNDGKQTPMRGHPAFVAQHATATCCRSCLAKWHEIEAGRELTAEEVDHCLAVIERWIRSNDVPADTRVSTIQQRLF